MSLLNGRFNLTSGDRYIEKLCKFDLKNKLFALIKLQSMG